MAIHLSYLEYCRLQKCWSQDKLARYVGCCRQTISRYEYRKSFIPVPIANQLALLFNEDYWKFLRNKIEISQEEYWELKKQYHWAKDRRDTHPIDRFLRAKLTKNGSNQSLTVETFCSIRHDHLKNKMN